MLTLRILFCGVIATTFSLNCLKAANPAPAKKARQLVAAAEAGNVQLCDALSKKKDIVNQRDDSRRTPLVAAAAEGHIETVETLLNAGADVDKAGPRGRTALMVAIINKRTNTAALLLNRHANPNARDVLGQTAAHFAVMTNQPTLLSWLVRYDADISLRDRMGHDPLDMATTDQRTQLARMLMKQNGPQQLTENTAQLLLVQAVAGGDVKTVSLLLNAGVNPNVPVDKIVDMKKPMPDWLSHHALASYFKKDSGIRLLMLASAKGPLKIVEKLLKSGAEIDARTENRGHSALDIASEFGREEVARRLLGISGTNPRIAVRVFLGRQKATLYVGGKEWFTTPISTGRKGYRTPTGSYVVTNKHRDWISNLYDAPMPYFLRLNYGAIGLHAGVVPGYPASHGCIRLPYNAAKKFFDKIPVGTLVSIEP